MEFSLVFRHKDDSFSLYERCHSGDVVISTDGGGKLDAQHHWTQLPEVRPQWYKGETYDVAELAKDTKPRDTKCVRIHPSAVDLMIARLDDSMKQSPSTTAELIKADPLQVDIPLETDFDGAETWVCYACIKMGLRHFRCYAPLLYSKCSEDVHPPILIYNAIALRYLGLLSYDASQPTLVAKQVGSASLIYGNGKTKLLQAFKFSDQFKSAQTVRTSLIKFCADEQWEAYHSKNACAVVASFHRIMRCYSAIVAAAMLSSLSHSQLRAIRPKAQTGKKPMDYIQYVTKLDVKPPGIVGKTLCWQVIACVRSVFRCRPMGDEEETILERLYSGHELSIDDQVTLFPPAVSLKEIHDTRRPYTVADVRVYYQLQTLLSSLPGLNYYPAHVVQTTGMNETVTLMTWTVGQQSRNFPSQWSGTICNATNLSEFARGLDTRNSPFKTLVPLTVASDYLHIKRERSMMTTVVGSMCQGLYELITLVLPVKMPKKGVILICVAPMAIPFSSCDLALMERFPRLYDFAYARVLARMSIAAGTPTNVEYRLHGSIKARLVRDDLGCGVYLILQASDCTLETGEFFLKLSERSARH
uniref:VP4 n=1 Tax=Bukakata virus TaxID=2547355 RepID=A0A482AC08_9REOV|nr:VP4 [Bukakata virus]